MQDEYCEGCQRTDDSQHYVLCGECADKAACYDITLRDRRFLYRGMRTIQPQLKEIQTDLQKLNQVINTIDRPKLDKVLSVLKDVIGRVDISVDDCAPTKSQEEKSE